mgnify:CR=1 FL=1
MIVNDVNHQRNFFYLYFYYMVLIVSTTLLLFFGSVYLFVLWGTLCLVFLPLYFFLIESLRFLFIF